MHRGLLVVAGMAIAAAVVGYVVYQQINKPRYAIEVDATKDTTDISGIMYRIRVTNVGTEKLTGITVELGINDIQGKPSLNPGESYFFYPGQDTQVSIVKVKTNEGIAVESD